MRITIDWLNEKGACSEAIEQFAKTFPEGEEYQKVLVSLAKENNLNWAYWLLKNVGPTKEVLEINGDLISETSIYFAGFIRVTGKIISKIYLVAGEGIKAGEDWGIYVGLSIKISIKAKYVFVIAKTKPKNLLLGEFKKKNY